MTEQLTLFDLDAFTSPSVHEKVYDPYWDEITNPQTPTPNTQPLTPQPLIPQPLVLEQDKLDTSKAQNPTNCVLEQVNIATAPSDFDHVEEFAPEHFHHFVLEQDKLDTSKVQNPTNCVLEQVNIATAPSDFDHVEEFAPEHFQHFVLKEFDHPQKFAPEHHHWVEEYSPSNRPGNLYYRYVWMEGRKLHHMHIRGGQVDKPRAIRATEEVLSAIANGKAPGVIIKIINQL